MRGEPFFLIMPIFAHSKMFLIETERNITKKNHHLRETEAGTDYWDNSYEYNEYGNEYSKEDEDWKNDIYGDDNYENDYYPNEVFKEPTKLSASTCRPRRGMGRDVTLNVTCGDRVSIDCDLPRHGGCISRIKKVAWNCDFFDRSKREHLMKIKELCEGKHECDFLVNHETFGPDFRRCSHKAESEYSLELVYSCPGRSRDHNKIEKNQYTCVIPTTTTTTTTTMMMGHND